MNYSNQKISTPLKTETIPLKDDYEGAVSASVDYHEVIDAKTAVIYIHGYMDYFFQTHLSDFFVNKGMSFYAVELRKYGSSIKKYHHQNFCKDVREYYEEISAVIHKAKEKGHSNIILHGHSTGGLTATHFLLHSPDKALVNATILNSPFFDFNASKIAKKFLPIITPLGKFFPYIKASKLPALYTKSLHKDYKGRWDFNLSYKPIPSFDTYLGWIRAISNAQKEIYSLKVENIPCLIMHSSQSYFKTTWDTQVLQSDAVLNIEDIIYYGEKIYQNVTLVSVENAIHDIVLSSDVVIDQYFFEISQWLDKHPHLQ